ncbi:MAG: exosortase family protein XrtG [Epulopiscium sp.]|nr:exosortase family protein XrtG [Candidatus Epulonipiscium sp.]
MTAKVIYFIVWLFVLEVLHRAQLKFWRFLWGSVGLFISFMIWAEPIMTVHLSRFVSLVAGFLGELTRMYVPYFEYGVLFIENKDSAISLYIDYECSGVIEIMVFLSMLWFFPVYEVLEKIIVSIIGVLWIFMANVLRIHAICTLIYWAGSDSYYIAHTILGRLIFYGFSIALYYYVFTRAHIIRQRIGGLRYENP